MTTTASPAIELRDQVETNSVVGSVRARGADDDADSYDGSEAGLAARARAYPDVPDGGYGWVALVSQAVFAFWFNGISLSWGVMQTALLTSGFSNTYTLSFVGTLSNTMLVALGLFAVRFMRLFGARSTALLGVALLGVGEIASGFVSADIGGLFGTTGVLLGSGASLLFMSTNVIPRQYFDHKLGLANGIVKGAGGIGGTILSVALDAMIKGVGIPWTFRILGFAILATGLPAAYFSKERSPVKTAPFVNLAMFRNLAYVAVFAGGAVGTFALFVPPYYVPLMAQSIGLSSQTGALMTAGFNLCATLGRFGAGPLCDYIGPVNTLLLTMSLNTLTMACIWPFASSLPPLIVFSFLNGVANGAFFTTFPTVVASLFDMEGAAVAMGMATTGWSAGYLMGPPIAGYLLQPRKGAASPVDPFRSAIFYSAGVACAGAVAILLARLRLTTKVLKKL